MRPLEEYQREFSKLTTQEAIEILTELKSASEGILLKSHEEHRFCRTTPLALCVNLPGETLAKTVGPFQFCGGPPGRFMWVSGTLQTFVIDKVMHFDAREELLREQYGMKIARGC